MIFTTSMGYSPCGYLSVYTLLPGVHLILYMICLHIICIRISIESYLSVLLMSVLFRIGQCIFCRFSGAIILVPLLPITL